MARLKKLEEENPLPENIIIPDDPDTDPKSE